MAHKTLLSSSILGHNLRSFLGEIWNWPPNTEGKERWKKEADHSRLVGGRFNKQRNLHTRLVLATQSRVDLCTHRQNLKFTQRLKGGSVTYTIQVVSTTHCSLKAASLKMGPTVGTVGRVYLPRAGEGRGASDCLGSACGSSSVTSSPQSPLTWRNGEICKVVPPSLQDLPEIPFSGPSTHSTYFQAF